MILDLKMETDTLIKKKKKTTEYTGKERQKKSAWKRRYKDKKKNQIELN